jgi:hypothetical protein
MQSNALNEPFSKKNKKQKTQRKRVQRWPAMPFGTNGSAVLFWDANL